MSLHDRTPADSAPGNLARRLREVLVHLPGPASAAEHAGGWSGLARRIVRWMVTGFRRTRANDLAAAVAYYALLAIVPTILALGSILGVILRTEDGYQNAVDVVLWLVPTGLVPDSMEVLPRLRGRSGAFGVASLVGFLWIGSTFFAALGRAMNRVYEVADRPPLEQRLRGVVSILVFFVLFSVAVIAATLPTVVLGIDEHELPLSLERWPIFTGLYQVVSYLVAVVVAIVLFGVIFRIVPNAGQRTEDIIPGALVIALAFVVLAQAFPIYLRIVSGWNLIGSTAGLLSLVLIWFYLLSHLFLFGAYINATWQQWHRRHH